MSPQVSFPRCLRLAEALAEAVDLSQILRETLQIGISRLGCQGGSVFLFDHGTHRLELREHTYKIKAPLSLEPGQGGAGRAYLGKEPLLLGNEEIDRTFVDQPPWGHRHLRHFVAIRVPSDREPAAVFCFDYHGERKDPEKEGESLGPGDRSKIADLAAEMSDPSFSAVLRRALISQARLDLHAAAESPGRQRQEVSRFLTQFQSRFPLSGKEPPDLIALQLVDRRRRVVRTVQGYGFGVPLALSALTHPLAESEQDDLECDIQAQVIRTRNLYLIVGNDRRYFDQQIFETFEHESLVRLFLPLFPFPEKRLRTSGAASPEEAFEECLSHWIEWDDAEEDGREVLRVVGRWGAQEAPPESLVYGTLEIGFRREDRTSLSLAPLSPELAVWCASQAYRLSGGLYRSTLEGSLESIGRAVSNLAQAKGTRLMMSLPDGHSAALRTYPIDPAWPSAVPAVVPIAGTKVLDSFVQVKLEDEGREVDTDSPFLQELQGSAKDAILLALRLDDHLTDVFSLVEEPGERENVSTTFDPALERFCREACILSSAETCSFYLFERGLKPESRQGETQLDLQSLEQVGRAVVWPRAQRPAKAEKLELGLAESVARLRAPSYLREEDAQRQGFPCPMVALPLDLVDRTLGVMVLSYHKGYWPDDESRRTLEGRLLRWAHRVSLRRLVVMNRFALLMGKLRNVVHEARKAAEAEPPDVEGHVGRFIDRVLSEGVSLLGALAGHFTVYASTHTGPHRVERLWCCGNGANRATTKVRRRSFLDKGMQSPCRMALHTKGLKVFGPGDIQRARETGAVVDEILSEVKNLTSTPDEVHELQTVTSLMKGEGPPSTMLVVPAPSRDKGGRAIDLALTVFLEGDHWYGQMQRHLVLELGELVAEGFASMHSLDRRAQETRHNGFHQIRRERFRKAQRIDDLIDGLFRGIGPGGNRAQHWDLATGAVLWLLAPDPQELVFYASYGAASRETWNLPVIQGAEHPLFAGRQALIVPRKSNPRLGGPFQLWTFDLQREAQGNAVCAAYAALSLGRWLLSFPLVDTGGRFFGVVDLLRVGDHLAIEDETALEAVLQRLSLQFCWALENCRLRRTELVARELNSEATPLLRALRIEEVFGFLVNRLRDEFQCSQCELYLDQSGAIFLHASTRENAVISAEARATLWVKPASGSGEILGECLGQKKAILFHAERAPATTQHLAPSLRTILTGDEPFERMALPLKFEGEEETCGVLLLRGPVGGRAGAEKAGNGAESIDKSGLFSEEELRLGENLVIAVQRILKMAQLVGQQSWLVSELVHSLGQPLHVLHAQMDEMLLQLEKGGLSSKELSQYSRGAERAFEAVKEDRDNLGLIGGASKARFESVDLVDLMMGCCRLLEPAAADKGVRFYGPQSSTVAPIRGDRKLLRRAVQNLLDNAVKYSYSKREISVDVREDRSGNVELSVTNHGVGIPPEHLERIFDPWFRSRVPDLRGERPGKGIGLTVAREAIERVHHGRLTVASKRRSPASTADGGPSSIVDVEHTTRFSIHLNRNTLQHLEGKEPSRGGSHV